jgi:serine protease Do
LLGTQVVAIDVETDLAVLKIKGHDLPTLELADSDDLGQGQLVLAFGSPRGLENSVTMGTVSARGRQLRSEDPMIYIQTDATINPGSSGGPLVDSQGRVVGINTLIFSRSGGSEGIGFAAPSNIVRSVFEQIRDTGRVRRGVIGVHAQTLTPVLAAGLGTPRDWGAILSDVTPGQPAHRAGMRPGDIVLSLDDKMMENGRQLTVNLYNKPIGRRVRLEILRSEEQLSFEVEVAERRDDPTRFVDFVDPDRNLVQPLGILCLEIDERVARLLPKTRKPAIVVVAARAPGAPYWEGSFEPGDILYSLNGLPVTGLDALRSRVEVLRAGDAVVFQVERDGRLRYVALRL